MRSSTSSSSAPALATLAGYAGLFLGGVLLALLAVWLVDRAGAWGRLGLDPRIAVKWQPARNARLPTYYVLPGTPTGGHHKRRGGPRVETRRVLAEASDAFGRTEHPYADLPPVRIEYGRYGFRSELPAEPGGHAILGASHVEAGFAPAAETIPGWLRARGIPASNFGLAGAGGQTLAHVLERFVLPTRPARVTWVFSEGYGFAALGEHHAARLRHRRAAPQLGSFWSYALDSGVGLLTSAGRRGADCLLRWRHPVAQPLRLPPQSRPPTARVPVGATQVQVDLSFPPPPAMFRLTQPLFAAALKQMSAACRAAGVAFDLVFIPCRATLYRDALPLVRATPGCGAFVLAECRRQGVPARDATPALRAVARDRLIVNPVYDLHLNAAGMKVVADVIAGD